MDALAGLRQVYTVQNAFQVIATLMLTAYLFPKQAAVRDSEEFDFVVVGAGSAGTVVAHRLAECGHRVLLVDAGGDPPVQSLTPSLFSYLSWTEWDWNYTTVRVPALCHRNQAINLTSGHVLGGGSSLNYEFYVRGCPGDFGSWAAVANDSSWDYDNILPYFIKSERLEDKEVLSSRYRRFHGTKGFLGVTREESPEVNRYLEAFRQIGNDVILDINGDRSKGYVRQMYTIAEGVRQSTAYSLLALRKVPNLELLKHTYVTRILFDDTNNAIGVQAITENGKEITLRARHEVIVSAGAISSPRLLMLSGVGPKKHLESLNIPVKIDLPVGDNLQDHSPIMLLIKMEETNDPPPPKDPHRFPYPAFSGYTALNRTQECPTYQAINAIVAAGDESLTQLCVFNNWFNFDICQNLVDSVRGRNSMLTWLTLLHPASRGTVRLSSVDPRAPPLIDPAYFSNMADVETIVDSLIDFTRVLNSSYFRSVNAELVDVKTQMCEGLEFMSRDWWRCYVHCLFNTIYHYSGTTALGSVVDSRLRVYGAGRLRVIDAGVMPFVVGANTNAATLAIGEKGADMIKRDHPCPNKPHGQYFSHNSNLWG